MFRIVDGIALEGKPSPNRFFVTYVDIGNGHREATVQRAIDWEERGDVSPDASEPSEDELEERRQANKLRASRRAKTVVRRRCKALGLDTLLTLTYRGLQSDLSVCEGHLHYFLKLMRSTLRAIGAPEFCYVACFERQKRGAWHVHLACHKLPARLLASNGVKVKSYNVVRALWRRVTGEWGGTINESARKGNSKRSAAKVAAYISKYVTKMFEAGEDHAKRYRWSRCQMPQVTREQFVSESFGDLISMVTQLCNDAGQLATVWLSKFGDVFFVAGESPPRGVRGV